MRKVALSCVIAVTAVFAVIGGCSTSTLGTMEGEPPTTLPDGSADGAREADVAAPDVTVGDAAQDVSVGDGAQDVSVGDGAQDASVGDAPEDASVGDAPGEAGDGSLLDVATDGPCPTLVFAKPLDAAKLTQKDDADADACKNGFQYDVEIVTSAGDGAIATLRGNTVQLGTATVSGGTATFKAVQLDSNGSTQLSADIGGCKTSIAVTVDCSTPTCAITKPNHAVLNGVPVAQGGDRVSGSGSAYQAAFEVTTNIEDGQPVALNVDAAATSITATASGGKAAFAGVTLTPDGAHIVAATCTNRAQVAGKSATGTFTVDSTPPDLTVTQPAAGKHFNPSDDVASGVAGLQFAVCATTSSADAIGVAGSGNLCVAIGTATPQCAAEVSGGACVNVTCPGSAAFDLNVTLKDAAGNPTTKTVQGITCSSTLPSVQIIDPTDGTGVDISKHILAASSAQARKDQDAVKAGAQYTVVACADRAGSAQLYTGQAGGALAANGTAVTLAAAQVADGCPTGLTYVARFVGATLPESAENPDGTLVTATEMRVDVTDSATGVGSSPLVDVWVDTSAPSVNPNNPSPLCGLAHQGSADWTTDLYLVSSVAAVTVTIGSAGALSPVSYSGGLARFNNVTFKLGTNAVSAVATDPAGNTGALQSPCVVTVGDVPVVTWIAPAVGQNLCASVTTSPTCVPDTAVGTPGWQGDLRVRAALPGTPLDGGVPAGDGGAPYGTVTFAVGSTTLGTANIDSSGYATLAVDLADANPIVITATANGLVGETQPGSADVTTIVDTALPGDVTALAATVKIRRQTTFHLAWTTPAGEQLSGYDVRVSPAAITAGNFDAAERVNYAGTPAAPGTADGIDVPDRMIEKDYYFAVKALDAVGNVGGVVSAGPAKATFNRTILQPPAGGPVNEEFGYSIDAASDLNGDGLSDLIVGSYNGNKLYIFFGSADFNAVAPADRIPPSVTITGNDVGFGGPSIVAGDIDHDGYDDLAVPSYIPGKVFIFKGRAANNPWPSALTEADADYVVTASSAFSGGYFGFALARLGDFNGDGADDFAIGTGSTDGFKGNVTIILGSATFPAAVTLPDDFGTRAIRIDGAAAGDALGFALVGMGRFYTATTGTTLLISAPYAASGKGRVYAFHGQSGTVGTISLASADHYVDGVAAGGELGYSMSLLGPGWVGMGAPFAASNVGQALLTSGTPAIGPFAGSSLTLADSRSTTRMLGTVVLGGGFSGSSVTTSMIGTSALDVVVAPGNEATTGAPRVYIIDGVRAGGLTSPADIVGTADVILSLPPDWRGASSLSNIVKDLDGDGFGDLAVGEYGVNYTGRAAVFW